MAARFLYAEISRRAFNRRVGILLAGLSIPGVLQACGGGSAASSRNVRPTNGDGSGAWRIVPQGQPHFVAQLGPDADIVPAADIGLPNKPNSQAEQSAIDDLANNQLVYFTNRTSFDPNFFDNPNSLSRNYAIQDIYTLNNENGGNAIHLMPVAGDPLNANSHTVLDPQGKPYVQRNGSPIQYGIYFGFTDASGLPIVLDPAQNEIAKTTNPKLPLSQQYILGNNVRLHTQ
jgi:hypothetical protein